MTADNTLCLTGIDWKLIRQAYAEHYKHQRLDQIMYMFQKQVNTGDYPFLVIALVELTEILRDEEAAAARGVEES